MGAYDASRDGEQSSVYRLIFMADVHRAHDLRVQQVDVDRFFHVPVGMFCVGIGTPLAMLFVASCAGAG